MQPNKIYDIIGIGIGPFNLGLAALTANIKDLSTIFIDQKENFNWHPGLLLPDARMQVPFYADLVTGADPTSKFSFMNYLHEKGRVYKFGVNEQLYPLRIEYNNYCRWVAGQLTSLHFNHRCDRVTYDEQTKIYTLTTECMKTNTTQQLHGKHLVIGIGSTPYMPSFIKESTQPLILHSSNYLHHKQELLQKQKVTLIGSGQSAAEVFLDLLNNQSPEVQLNWYTSSTRFHPMEIARFTLELSSPDYIDYFYALSPMQKRQTLKAQDHLYKGINQSLLGAIYDQLYQMEITASRPLPLIQANTTLTGALINEGNIELHLQQNETNTKQTTTTGALILATGYTQTEPPFLMPLNNRIQKDAAGKFQLSKNYAIDEHSTIFLQNADLHTHGFNSADLGLGPYRNAAIINTIVKREHFKIHPRNIFQSFTF